MKVLNTFIISFFILLFSGCGGPKPSTVKKAPPVWVSTILPNDTSTKMYGMAISENREIAIKNALADMVARQGISIESTFQSKEVVEKYYSSSIVKYDMKSEVSKIKVNNYKVVKSYRISYKEFAVMIETDKLKFIKGLKENLLNNRKIINQEYDSLLNQDVLHRYNAKKTLSIRASKLLPQILIISTLDKNFDKDANINFVLEKKKKFLIASNNLKFYIFGNKKSILFVDKIKNNLAQNGFNIANTKKNAVLVKLHTIDNIGTSKTNIAVLSIKVSVSDNSKHIGGKNIIIKERYNNSIRSVYKNASIHFETDIQEMGIKELIGINLDNYDKELK